MPYVTTSTLLDQFAADEIAQRADRSIPRLVTAEMLTTAAAGGDMSGYTADEQAATATALALIEGKLLDADSVIDGYLLSRFTTPLESAPRLVVGIACDLTRYALYDDIATEQITQRYKDALKMLDAIGSGKVGLGISPAGGKPASSGSAYIESASKVFSRAGRE